MVDNLLFYDLLLVVLLWLGGILYEAWSRRRSATCPTTRKPATPIHKHSRDPKAVSWAHPQTPLYRL